MKRSYHTLNQKGQVNERKLTEFLVKNGQSLLPMVELVEQSQVAIEELIDTVGRATIEAVLEMSACQLAGPPQQGKTRTGDIVWHGRQRARIHLRDRQLEVDKPRLRRKGKGPDKEVAIPAYQALQDRGAMQDRMLSVLLDGVSTRRYQEVIPRMAQTVGVSKSSVSRESVQAAERQLETLLARRFDDIDLLIIYIDGIHFGEQCVIGAVGVDAQGRKHVLGVQEGATENAAAVTSLLEDLVARGVKPERQRLFVIDGSKALRTAINAVFGQAAAVQRCRHHKLRNVVDRLPKDQQAQASSLLKAAWKLPYQEGMQKLKKLAEWLERAHPDAAASLREGMEECFTINRLEVPPSLHRCLATTNLIESPHSGIRQRTGRTCRWRDKPMAKRWAAAAFVDVEQKFRRIIGYQDLWALAAILEGKDPKHLVPKDKVA